MKLGANSRVKVVVSQMFEVGDATIGCVSMRSIPTSYILVNAFCIGGVSKS